MPKDKGGSAFPNGYHHGMTLRDYFAGQVLAGFLANVDNEEHPFRVLAEMAYLQADAMIAERNKGE